MKKLFKFQVRVFAIATILLVSISGVFAQQKIAIIDAGSSGSRLYVYDISNDGKSVNVLCNKKKDWPLSNVIAQKDSVRRYVDTMTRLYENNTDTSIDLYVLATAGMRYVDSTKAGLIYRYMADSIKTINNYQIKKAMTISGRYEGFYAWIAANYKHNKLGFSISTHEQPLAYTTGDTYGIIEIGGASMQIAFALNQSCPEAISRGGFSNIYCKSYLGGGVDKVYDNVLKSNAVVNDKYKFSIPLDSNSTIYKHVHKFIGLGTPIGIILKEKEKITGDHSCRAYAASLKNNDATNQYHPYTNAYYVAWIVNSLELEGKVIIPTKPSDWTEGAAIDIVVNKEMPEEFNYDMGNPN